MTPATLPIEAATAPKPYPVSPEEQRRQFQAMLEEWRRASAGLSHLSLAEIEQRLAAEAAANGLTQEILDEILSDPQ